MNEENTNQEVNEQKLLKAFNSNLKLHIVLKDKTWRNGFVKELKADFFLFEDKINGIEPIFFLELLKVEPYLEELK